MVEGPSEPAGTPPPTVAALDALARLHTATDTAALYPAAVEAVERLCRGSVAALFQPGDASSVLTLVAAGPGWRSAERDAPAWLVPLSGAFAELVRSGMPAAGCLVDQVPGGPYVAAYPCGGVARRRLVLLVAWRTGGPCRTADAAVAERLARHVALAGERVEATTGLQEAAAAMCAAQREVVHAYAERASSSLAGGTAHELNNALSVLLGVSECLLAGPPLDEQTRSDVEEMRDAATRLARLAHRLTFVARSARQGEVTELDVDEVLQGALDRVRAEGGLVEVLDGRPARRSDGGGLVAAPADLMELVVALLRLHVESRGGVVHVRDSAAGTVIAVEVTAARAEADDPFDLCYSRPTRWRGPVLAACRRLAAAHGWQLALAPGDGPRQRVELTLPTVPLAPGRPPVG